MEKPKRWQLVLITVVVFLTIYNILPTALYYMRPLKEGVKMEKGLEIAQADMKRVNALEKEAIDWLKSFNKLLGVSATSIEIDQDHPQFISLKFNKDEDASLFKKYLPRAGSLIPFVPAQLSLTPDEKDGVVTVQRNIPIHFSDRLVDEYFKFTEKRTESGDISPLYKEIVDDRLMQLGLAIGGISENAQYLDTVLSGIDPNRSDEFLMQLSHHILTYGKLFGENSPIAKRYFATFTQGPIEGKSGAISSLIASFERLQSQTKVDRIQMQEKERQEREKGGYLESVDQQKLDFLISREEKLTDALSILRRNSSTFASGTTPWTYAKIKTELAQTSKIDQAHAIQTIPIGNASPLINQLTIDWNNEKIFFEFHSDILALRKSLESQKGKGRSLDQLDQLIYNEIARISRESGETITPFRSEFQLSLNSLTDSKSLLVMDLRAVAAEEAKELTELVKKRWNPTFADLKREAFPIWDYKTFKGLPKQEQKLGLVVYAPSQFDEMPPTGFRTNSVYVIAKGINTIYNKFRENPNSPQAKAFLADFSSLRELLKKSGFFEYPGSTYPLSADFANDFMFEAEDFYKTILSGTREDYRVHGTRKFATLEFSNLEQRIHAINRIETEQHEDLLKWRDEYQTAQAKTNLNAQYDIPAPTTNPLLSNLALSARKYFRGDERKILHWGLDLSGGKTVQIQLRDPNGRVVQNEADIKQGINELYSRVNQMGVSEVSIRQEGSNITLDFPSAQGLSANDLIKASSMYFHVVNEKFGLKNPSLATTVNEFLQGVWNEAVVTNQKDPESIHLIAWKHLYGDTLDTEIVQPVSEAAKVLYDQGLRLASPSSHASSNAFNDSISKIAIMRGNSFAEWQGQSHPLLIVMNNYALEGSNLTNVHAGYDPSRGNYLAFEVKSSQTLSDGQKLSPRQNLLTWTTPFSKEKVQGSSLAELSRGEGWRMAVILNGKVIQAPPVASPLKDHVSITGSFTQREVNRLEADLKAGSLSFAPYILSEKNVSPELGIKDRKMGILATITALVLVMVLMIGYYRFSGVVASIAVLFNLLIMWATLQNIQATITLAGIAGIILTVGMAVDANVLVFERIREEFSKNGRLATAVHTGYKKAFSAILDSNVTTIIAAVILLHFDSGPIKGFALTLIIGIVSSMFSALFMTRYFFTGWVQRGKNKTLKMASFIKASSFNFLRRGKLSFGIATIITLVGAYFFVSERSSMLGMDFTGGYSLSLEVEPSPNTQYRDRVENALLASGITKQELQVRELSPSNNIKILLSKELDQAGKPFFEMPLEVEKKNLAYQYEINPRLVWVVQALESHGIEMTPQSLKQLDSHWSSISGQMSDAMRNNALLGLSLALLCILVYITVRFEFKYAISATLGLAIDVVVTLGMMSILHGLKVPVQIDLNTIAALMTIIGYSLNDTIIVFDRIREDLKLMRKHSFKDVVNHALNVTLSRTVMTSATTLIVLLALLALGGSTIFGLSLVMVIGVVIGTFSSLFIAAPLLLFFHRKEEKKGKKLSWNEN